MSDDIDPPDRELTPEELAEMRPVSLAKRAQLVSGLGRERFAARYGIPLDQFVRWQRREEEPDPVAKAYLQAILNDPDAVAAAYNKTRSAA